MGGGRVCGRRTGLPRYSFGADKFSAQDVPIQPADMAEVLHSLLALDPAHPVRRRLDGHRVAAAGHSAGAISALGLFSTDGPEGRDERFRAGIILTGNSIGVGEHFTGSPATLLFVHAAQDPVVPFWTGQSAYRAVPWPKAFLTLGGDQHISPYTSTRDQHFEVVATATLDFLRYTLYGDQQARARLSHVDGLDNHLRAA